LLAKGFKVKAGQPDSENMSLADVIEFLESEYDLL